MILRSFRLGLLHRRTLRALEHIETHLATQNTLLARLVDQIAPQLPNVEAPASADIDFLNMNEAAAVLQFVAQTRVDLGREPTEEEILRYLAEEATIDLQARMEDR